MVGYSQKSFVTEDVRETLNLRSLKKERMIVRGFGNKDEVMKTLDVVRVKLWNPSESICTDCMSYRLFVAPSATKT